jgi:hypothetical protein
VGISDVHIKTDDPGVGLASLNDRILVFVSGETLKSLDSDSC